MSESKIASRIEYLRYIIFHMEDDICHIHKLIWKCTYPLSHENIQEFVTILKRRFGRRIRIKDMFSDENMTRQKMLQLHQILLQILEQTQEKLEKLNSHLAAKINIRLIREGCKPIIELDVESIMSRLGKI